MRKKLDMTALEQDLESIERLEAIRKEVAELEGVLQRYSKPLETMQKKMANTHHLSTFSSPVSCVYAL